MKKNNNIEMSWLTPDESKVAINMMTGVMRSLQMSTYTNLRKEVRGKFAAEASMLESFLSNIDKYAWRVNTNLVRAFDAIANKNGRTFQEELYQAMKIHVQSHKTKKE